MPEILNFFNMVLKMNENLSDSDHFPESQCAFMCYIDTAGLGLSCSVPPQKTDSEGQFFIFLL